MREWSPSLAQKWSKQIHRISAKQCTLSVHGLVLQVRGSTDALRSTVGGFAIFVTIIVDVLRTDHLQPSQKELSMFRNHHPQSFHAGSQVEMNDYSTVYARGVALLRRAIYNG